MLLVACQIFWGEIWQVANGKRLGFETARKEGAKNYPSLLYHSRSIAALSDEFIARARDNRGSGGTKAHIGMVPDRWVER